MRPFVLLVLLIAACSQSSGHPAPIGDCPPGDSCNSQVGGGGAHPLPEGGAADEAGVDDGGTFPDSDIDVNIPPVDAAFE